MGVLETIFRNPYVVSEAFRNKLDHWPRVNSKDGAALRKFANFFKQCYAGMQSNSNLKVLDDAHESHKILAKLPEDGADWWQPIQKNHGAFLPSDNL